jgi:hypothetical protein
LYTGLGPVCGTIIRGAGGAGGAAAAAGAAGRGGTGGVCGGVEAATEDGAGDGGTITAAGGAGGTAGRGGAATEGAGGATGFSAGGATIAGRGAAGGIGAAAGVDGAAGTGVGFAGAGGATAGLATTGGAAGRGVGGGAADSFFCVIAFSTSPGREMCDRSILVLISSSPRNGREVRAAGDCASAEPRIWARTFSASWSSMELECVFFSVTPTSGSASRMALLFTSSSLARSLIRTLLIRPFVSPL